MLFFVVQKNRLICVTNKKFKDVSYATSTSGIKLTIANTELAAMILSGQPMGGFEKAMGGKRFCVIEALCGVWLSPRYEPRYRNEMNDLADAVREANMDEAVGLIFQAIKKHGLELLPPPDLWKAPLKRFPEAAKAEEADGWELVDEGLVGLSIDDEFEEVSAEDCVSSDNGSLVESFFVNLPEIKNPDAKDRELLDELLIREIVIKKK